MNDEQFLIYLAGVLDAVGHIRRERVTYGANKGRYRHIFFVNRNGPREYWQPILERAAQLLGGACLYDFPGMAPEWQARKVVWHVLSYRQNSSYGDTRAIAARLAPYSVRHHDLLVAMSQDEVAS